eukprot:CAMPEP_0168578322 /NCGR_PEP_ID=MMETSP0413-20121227/21267_1 /TAXON_ID=136452 /ORGANISM="Filamoeba nolandi, Strain NC-AS-23-1" /LENGTH=456 /DNA_ID=CAMNT_0008612153 /DNA_START=31 /DNA_END=1401 /DNA_ORIENTATION=-
MEPNNNSSENTNGTSYKVKEKVVYIPDFRIYDQNGTPDQNTGQDQIDEEAQKESERQGLVKVFTKAIGFDITTISIPVSFNEPASFLMRLCEAIQYTDLLDKASQCENSMERLMYIAIFSCTCYAVAERTGKPFNPLLGETYEYVDDSRENFKFIAEQVSHHPPVGACYAENNNWQFWQSQRLKTKFTGNSLDCQAVGSNNVKLRRTNEHFKWQCVKTAVHNVIVGKIWIDHYGETEVYNKATGEKAVVRMKQCGWFSKGWHEVEGEVLDAQGNPCIQIFGKWNEAIHAKVLADYKQQPEKKDKKKEKKGKKNDNLEEKLSKEEALWVHTNLPLPVNELPCKYMIDWSSHSLQVVQCSELQRKTVPPTDGRLRPDRISLEKGDVKKAGQEKHMLEERQRDERRKREKNNEEWVPKYFKLVMDEDDQEYWQYVGGYFEAREERVREYQQLVAQQSTK